MDSSVKFPWWQWLPLWGWRLVAVVGSADEVPECLPRNGVMLVGDVMYPKWIAFDCPCRLGHRIMVNADRQRKPFWGFTMDRRRRVTITPSVDYFDKVKRCHYIMQGGKILWARDSYR